MPSVHRRILRPAVARVNGIGFSAFWFPIRTAIFEHRHILAFAVLVSILISLPMLGNGLFLDDYVQRINLLSGNHENLFEFYRRGNPLTEAQIQSGVLPWWTHQESKIQFFRPLSELLIKLDYELWPNNFVLMHLHSVAWFALLVFVAGLVYRSIMPAAWAAGFAAVLFAVDAHHAVAVAWLCNRNVLVSMICCLLCLLCHRRETIAWRLAAWFLFALGLTSGESTLAFSGYLLAHELFLSERSWPARFWRLLPYALIGLGFLWYWHHAGYGTAGPGFYIDPVNNPILFLQEFFYRAPAYIVSQFIPPPVEFFTLLELQVLRDRALIPALLYSQTVLVLLAWFFWPLLRRSPAARFYAFGLLIAVIPICGVTMVSRVLWYVGFGATGLLALYLQQIRESAPGMKIRRFEFGFVGLILIYHFWFSPLLYIAEAKGLDLVDQKMDSQAVHLPDASGMTRKILFVSSKSHGASITIPIFKDQALSLGTEPIRPRPSIVKVRALIEGDGRLKLERPDTDTLYIRSQTSFDGLRAPPYRFNAGDTVQLDDVEVRVLSVSQQGAPIEIQFHFKPGALGSYEVMEWQHDRFVAATLPAIGSSREVSVD